MKYYFMDPLNDPGDLYDPVKWNFPIDSLDVVYIEGYPYKVSNKNHVDTLIIFVMKLIDLHIT